MVGGCGQMFGFWSEVDLTVVSHLEAAQRPCGQRGAFTSAHAVLGARRGLCAWLMGRTDRAFHMSTMCLSFSCFSPCVEKVRLVGR